MEIHINDKIISLPNGSEDICEWCINRNPRPFEDENEPTFASLTEIKCDYYESIKKKKFKNFAIPYCNNYLMKFEADIKKIKERYNL
jgi:hypothetical protein